MKRAFTLVELLSVLAIVSALAALTFSAATKAAASGKRTVCGNNERQLAIAWQVYATDYKNEFVLNLPGGRLRNTWAMGSLDFNDGNSSNTNENEIIGDSRSLLGPYSKVAKIYRCPGDRSFVFSGALRLPRVRSYSMNGRVGNGKTEGPHAPESPFRTFSSLDDMPQPGRIFVFVEELEDSIDDAWFNSPAPIATQVLESYPGNVHRNGCNFTFADGHSEFHLWTDARTIPTPGRTPRRLSISPGNRDVIWMSQHTTVLKP